MSIHNAPPLVFGEAPPDVECRDRNAAYAVIRDGNGLVAAIQFRVRGRDLFWLPGGDRQVFRLSRQEFDIRVQADILNWYGWSGRKARQ